ncbi:HD domain protein [Rickettsia parkeri str. Tate's Hell]|uniref:HD domain protein n=1 Tax=Rickettsia parkeri str. Tate's Hell TaxID=1359189 RepID=A0ABR5DQZ3_RICPA|nr:guanosine polyphosphate pyrophosphohydrolase/synthetase [Rickettsia parkeri str. Portsmouth]KJV94056.1 HD domain protein [Rickettsia parkeri str. Grand Bay]KJV95384.1 HD domain protein [Rickettsia parkeri str. AT\
MSKEWRNMVKNQVNCKYEESLNCYYSKRLLQKLLLLDKYTTNKIDFNQVTKAIYYAKKYHNGQKRRTGELFYTHSLEVAYMVSDYIFKTDIIVTAILHDVIEDTECTQEMIAEAFSDKIASYVEDLTRIKKDHKISAVEMVKILYIQKKDDLLLIKLFDRLHNIQTVRAKSLDKIWQTTSETLQIFLALAAYLKIPEIAGQLEKHCLGVIFNYEILQSAVTNREKY